MAIALGKGVFNNGVYIVLMAAQASRLESEDTIGIVVLKEARAGVHEIHFLLFSPTDCECIMHQFSKGAPEQILDLAYKRCETESRVQSLEVVYQKFPQGRKESPWNCLGPMPPFDPQWHDSAENRRMALNLGLNHKLITGQVNDKSIVALPVNELIEKADGFAGVFPECKYKIVKRLQARKHTCGMTGDGINDASALKKADIRIAVADATDAARSASGIVLTEPDLTVFISAMLTSPNKFQWMKNYTIYAVSITIKIVLGFMLLVLVWKFDFPSFIVLIIAILNDGTIMTISRDTVKLFALPDSWKLAEIFTTGGVVLGAYSAMMTCIFFWAAYDTDFFYRIFEVRPLQSTENHPTNFRMLVSAIYLQASLVSLALIFVSRSRSWSFIERPGLLLIGDFLFAQLEVPEGRKESPGGCPWSFLGLLPPFDLVRHETVEARRRALSVCAHVRMISTETVSSNATTCFEHKYKIVECLEAWKHFCWMTGDDLNDVTALKEADIGIAVADVLAKPEHSVIMSAVPSSRDIQSLLYNLYCARLYVAGAHIVLIFATLNDRTITKISG